MRTTATSGHPRRSADQWRAIIQRYESSDLSQREFCSQEGLTGVSQLTAPRPRKSLFSNHFSPHTA